MSKNAQTLYKKQQTDFSTNEILRQCEIEQETAG